MGTRTLKALSRASSADEGVKGLGLDSCMCSSIYFQDPKKLTGIINPKNIFYCLFTCIYTSVIVALHVYANSHRSQKRIPGAKAICICELSVVDSGS